MMLVGAILSTLCGAAASLLMLVLIVASAPNSTPAQAAGLRALAIGTLAVALASIVGSASAVAIARSGVATVLGAMPLVWCVAAVALMMLLDSERVARAGSPIARTIAMLIFTPLAVMLLVVGVRETARQAWLIRTASPVDAIIIDSRVEASTSWDSDRRINRDNSTTTYEPIVRFRFTLDGVEHEGSRLRPTAIVQTFPSRDAAAAILTPYSIGASVEAWTTASHPEWAFLERIASLGPLIFTTIGLALPGLTWTLARLLL